MKEEILPVSFLRFCAAFMVVLVHRFHSFIDHGYIPQHFMPLAAATKYGYLGVDLFFLISGFVISMSADNVTIIKFVSNRFIRLFPVFWVCVFVAAMLHVFVIKTQTISFSQFVANLTMMPDYYNEQGGPIDGVYWTLWVELKFYCFIAFLLVLRLIKKFSLESVALVSSFFLFYYFIIFSINPYIHGFFQILLALIFMGTFVNYGQYFFGGMLFYGLYKSKKPRYLAGIFVCYIVALFIAIDRSNYNPAIDATIVTSFFGLFFAISYKLFTNDSCARVLGKNIRRIPLLGALTYPLYLMHNSLLTSLEIVTQKVNAVNFFGFIIIVSMASMGIIMINNLDRYMTSSWKESRYVKDFLAKAGAFKDSEWIKKMW